MITILIGGTNHGRTIDLRNYNGHRIQIEKQDYGPACLAFGFEEPTLEETMEWISNSEETYEKRQIGLHGTQRRMTYHALLGLSSNDFERLVDQFENDGQHEELFDGRT